MKSLSAMCLFAGVLGLSLVATTAEARTGVDPAPGQELSEGDVGVVLAQDDDVDGAGHQLPPGDGIAPADSPSDDLEEEDAAVQEPAVEGLPDVDVPPEGDPREGDLRDVVQPDVEP